jgi:uncharacterized OsmC-like protein
MGTLAVTWQGGDRFAASVRGHQVLVDQPEADGGEDSAPTPVELLVASLTTCVAHYARRYLRRRELPQEGLVVAAEWEMAKTPSRVGSVALRITLPQGVAEEHHEPLLRFASHCTVHNTLDGSPDVSLMLA